MEDHENTVKRGRKKTRSLLLLLAGSVLVLLSIVFVGLRTHAEGNTNTESDQIIITNSGSTNTPGSTLTINSDGSGALHYKRGHWPFETYKDRSFAAHTFAFNQFKTLIVEIKNVQTIPNHSCPKSISFGSVITITYHGETSGDVSCLSMQDGKVLYSLRTLVHNTYALIMHQKQTMNM